jgi:Protein of unknown function (DUF642)
MVRSQFGDHRDWEQNFMKDGVKAIFVAFAIGSAGPAAAGVVANGGFEDGSLPPVGDGSVRQISPGDTSISGWTVNARPDSPIAWYTNGYEPPNNLQQIAVGAHNGNLAVNLGDGSVRFVSVSQTIDLLPFQEYQVSYWVGNYSANGGPAAVDVEIRDGTSNTIILSETGTARATTEPSTWERFAFNFIADGTSNTITLAEAIDPYYTGGVGPTYTGLDDVSVIAVPELSTWALALVGFAGLGAVGLRGARKLAPA